MSPISFFNPGENEIVYDLCAAPGGKSVALYQKMSSGELVANDISEKRQQRTKENLNKVKGNSKVKVSVFVSSESGFSLPEKSADWLLLDVPCSNTGVIRKRPDVKLKFNNKQLKELIKIQKDILNRASRLLKDEGYLIYSTCSIEQEENSFQVERFLKENSEYSLVKERILLPCEIHDGGYSALLHKNKH